jgi:hypothetical protein
VTWKHISSKCVSQKIKTPGAVLLTCSTAAVSNTLGKRGSFLPTLILVSMIRQEHNVTAFRDNWHLGPPGAAPASTPAGRRGGDSRRALPWAPGTARPAPGPGGASPPPSRDGAGRPTRVSDASAPHWVEGRRGLRLGAVWKVLVVPHPGPGCARRTGWQAHERCHPRGQGVRAAPAAAPSFRPKDSRMERGLPTEGQGAAQGSREPGGGATVVQRRPRPAAPLTSGLAPDTVQAVASGYARPSA